MGLRLHIFWRGCSLGRTHYGTIAAPSQLSKAAAGRVQEARLAELQAEAGRLQAQCEALRGSKQPK